MLDSLDRLADGDARREVERQRYRRKLALMVDRQRLGLGRKVREGTHRNLRAAGRRDVDLLQRTGVGLELRLDLEDDLVLAGRGIDVGHLPLPERVVERLI